MKKPKVKRIAPGTYCVLIPEDFDGDLDALDRAVEDFALRDLRANCDPQPPLRPPVVTVTAQLDPVAQRKAHADRRRAVLMRVADSALEWRLLCENEGLDTFGLTWKRDEATRTRQHERRRTKEIRAHRARQA